MNKDAALRVEADDGHKPIGTNPQLRASAQRARLGQAPECR
jgi:hypothetical protein